MIVYDNDFFVFWKVLGEEELYVIRYILFVYNSCFYIKKLCHLYAVRASNGFHVVSFYKSLISYSLSYLWFLISRVRKDWVVDNYFVNVVRVITLYIEIIVFQHAIGVEVVIILSCIFY